MKSWRFTGTNEPLQLAELPEPTAGPGQVVVDVKAAGICHTDVGILTDPGWMTMLAQVPVTLGHEDAGVISQVGEGVNRRTIPLGEWSGQHSRSTLSQLTPSLTRS